MDRIVELRKLLEYYNYLYYVKNEPVVTDQKFDELMHELERLEAEHPEMLIRIHRHSGWGMTRRMSSCRWRISMA